MVKQFGKRNGCVGIQVGMTILEVGAQPRARNTCLRIFIFWMVVEALSVGKAIWKSVESEKSKVARTIQGGPVFKSMKKKRT